jgi:hypothetical protein
MFSTKAVNNFAEEGSNVSKGNTSFVTPIRINAEGTGSSEKDKLLYRYGHQVVPTLNCMELYLHSPNTSLWRGP